MNNSIWRTAFASAIGAAHINQNTECQDRFACQTVETKNGEVLIAAVADGAGSTQHGQIGAETACRFFMEEISLFLNSQDASVESLNIEFGRFWISYFQKKLPELPKNNQRKCANLLRHWLAR